MKMKTKISQPLKLTAGKARPPWSKWNLNYVSDSGEQSNSEHPKVHGDAANEKNERPVVVRGATNSL